MTASQSRLLEASAVRTRHAGYSCLAEVLSESLPCRESAAARPRGPGALVAPLPLHRATRAACAAALLALAGVVVALAVVAGFGHHTRKAHAEPRSTGAFEVKVDRGKSGKSLPEAPGGGCGGVGAAGRFSTQAEMQAAGWQFSWADPYTFKPARGIFGSTLPDASYWGFCSNCDGLLSLQLRGEGLLAIDFGNSWVDPAGKVTVLINGGLVAEAAAGETSQTARIAFHSGDVLELSEATGVIVLNSFEAECVITEGAGLDAADLENRLMQRQQEEQEEILESHSGQVGEAEASVPNSSNTSTTRTLSSSSLTASRTATATTTPTMMWPGPTKTSTVTTTTTPRFCNRSAPVPVEVRPRSFDMPEKWRRDCEGLAERPDDDDAREVYPGRNWCWAWMKVQGCYWTKSHWTWWEAQERIALEGHAPDPHLVPFEPLLNASVCERRLLGSAPAYSHEELLDARDWVDAHVTVYVLNLPQDRERWHKIQSRLRELGLEAERIEGVDMSQTGSRDACYQEDLIPRNYDLEEAEKVAADSVGGITGTVGCASAHFRALRAAADSPSQAEPSLHARPLALIMEDDAELEDDFNARLRALLDEVPCDWNAMSLKTRCPYGACVSPHLTRVWPDRNEPESKCRHGVNYGFYAMLYRKEALPRIFAELQTAVWHQRRPRCLDIDVALASISDKIPYYAVPSLQLPGLIHEGNQGSARYTKNLHRLPGSRRGSQEDVER